MRLVAVDFQYRQLPWQLQGLHMAEKKRESPRAWDADGTRMGRDSDFDSRSPTIPPPPRRRHHHRQSP
jgi:hypothetical protein